MKFDTLKKELFKEIVGQERAKKQISYFLEGQWATGRSPNFLLRGARGMGKTTIAKEIGKHLIVFEGNKPVANEKKPDRPLIKGFLPVECSRIKNLDQFINGFIIKHDVPNKAMTLFLDEAHSMPQDMEDALLGRAQHLYL
jgi:replication-associated recombination protein RarA